MKKYRVATISSSKTGGAGIAAHRLHSNININSENFESTFIYYDILSNKKNGNDSEIILKYKNPNFFKRITRRLGHDTIWISKYSEKLKELPLNYEVLSFPFSYSNLEEELLKINPDIIHLHWVSGIINYPTFFYNFKHIPIVWSLHDMYPFQGLFHYKEDENRNLRYVKNLNNKILKIKREALEKHKNISVVCLAEWLKNESVKSEIFKNRSHYIIPNSIDEILESSIGNENSKELELISTNKNLLFISQFVNNDRKGLDLFLESLKKVKNKSRINLIIIGDYQDKGVFQSNELKTINTNFIGKVESSKMYQYYNLADITILPSREDNLPNVMLESFANGTPVMAFNTGGMAEHILPKENGILIEPFSIDNFANELDKFIIDGFSFNSDKIIQYSKDNFSANLQLNRFEKLYSSLVSK